MFVLRKVQSTHKRDIFNMSKLLFQPLKTENTLSKNSDIIDLNVHGEILNFPSVWLRDNCQCHQCFHPSAQSRIINWKNFNVNVTASNIQEGTNAVKIHWDDGHVSQFQLDWLKSRSFAPESQEQYRNFLYKPDKKTWSGDQFLNIITRHDYDSVLESDTKLHDWLQNLAVYGVNLIENVPNDKLAIDKIIEKVGFAKKTHYGEKFTVQSVANTSNVAYLSGNLQVHTDLPYYEYCPGVNILHCLVQTSSEGGDNMLIDSHYVANYMKKNHPNDYRLLTTTDVEWSDIGTEHGNEFYKLYRSPVICENKYGEITRINFSVPQRGNHFPVDINIVKPWYCAHYLFHNLAYKFAAKFKTKPGEMLVFDNIRLLHGRTEYKDVGNNVRKLIGAYLDWDEIYSRLRCLKVKLKLGSTSL